MELDYSHYYISLVALLIINSYNEYRLKKEIAESVPTKRIMVRKLNYISPLFLILLEGWKNK